MSRTWDVIVVGGGPGGALAAKKCAAAGLRTLLLEKKKMPRDRQHLIENHGLAPELEPLWRDGCAQPALLRRW
jgi:flavin-dependent dehydrogenase